ncbi:DUF2306 domain-containing protein [Desulfonatronum thioautotrophicum]|uniref:DUF2306 domain-containing protein n=1 Tax=Desulfonatronum thioautotrophicum TaxID=617001 RepID=UPI0005EBD6C6|nr:DUF2306 domain-containing protein [Desulfonatronum thioautotrophicum]
MDLAPLTSANWIIQIHTYAAVLAFVLGIYQFSAPKGDRVHRSIGYLWAGLMIAVAMTSFGIFQLRIIGPFSPIHLISIYVCIVTPMAVLAARQHQIPTHRANMIGLFVGGLVVAGGFTFIPGRIMHAVFLGG